MNYPGGKGRGEREKLRREYLREKVEEKRGKQAPRILNKKTTLEKEKRKKERLRSQ